MQTAIIETEHEFMPQESKGKVKQMWNGGPLRRWSATPVNGWIPYATGGYAGTYVCSVCQKAVGGVYEPDWACRACRGEAAKNPIQLVESSEHEPSKKELARIADVGRPSLPSDPMPSIAPLLAENGTADSQSEPHTPEIVPVPPVLTTVGLVDDWQAGFSENHSPESVTELSVTLPARRRRNPWSAYTRPAGVIAKAVIRPVPNGPRPERARAIRKTPLHRAVYIPDYVKQAKIREQNNCCVYCERLFGSPIRHSRNIEILEPQAEHFTPRSASGRNVDSNLNYACHVCNRLKSDYLFENVAEVKAWLTQEWAHKDYESCPPLVPFKRSAVMSYN